MSSDIRINTSYVSKRNLETFKKYNILPIFIIRDIESNDLIKNYSNSLVHFKDLSPTNNTFKIKFYDFNKFRDIFKSELLKLDLNTVIKRLEYLLQLSEAKGIVLLGYGTCKDECHRSIVAEVFNSSNLLTHKITELIL